jgi:hypothetical protein
LRPYAPGNQFFLTKDQWFFYFFYFVFVSYDAVGQFTVPYPCKARKTNIASEKL